MTADPVLVAISLALTALAIVQARQLHTAIRQVEAWRRLAEEADAWSDEYQREADTLRAENIRLLEQIKWLDALYNWHVRSALAANWRLVTRNPKR